MLNLAQYVGENTHSLDEVARVPTAVRPSHDAPSFGQAVDKLPLVLSTGLELSTASSVADEVLILFCSGFGALPNGLEGGTRNVRCGRMDTGQTISYIGQAMTATIWLLS